jgi:hypothetical protein
MHAIGEPHWESKQTQQARENPARQPAKQTQRKTRPRYRMPCTRQAIKNNRQGFTLTKKPKKAKQTQQGQALKNKKAP